MAFNIALNIGLTSMITVSISSGSPGDVVDIRGLTASEARDATYSWRYVDGAAISGATAAKYTLRAADVGRQIQSVVKIGVQTITSSNKVSVSAAVTSAEPPSISAFSRDRTLFDSGSAVGRDSAEIPLSGTAGPGAALEARIVTDDNQQVEPWTDIAVADGSGNWSGSVFTGQNADWMRPQVRLKSAPDAVAQTSNRFGVGMIFVFSEQSNGARIVNDYDGLMVNGAIQAGPILDPEAFQFIEIDSRGEVTGADTGVVGPFRFITDTNRYTKPLAEMASILTRNAPGQKVLMIADVKSGVGQDATLNDNDATRSFEVVRSLFDKVTADGATVGGFVLSHTNGVIGSAENYAEYIAQAFLNRNLDGTVFASSYPATISNGRIVHHSWSEILPGLLTNDTALVMQGSGFGGVYSGGAAFGEGVRQYEELRAAEMLAAAPLPTTVIKSANHSIVAIGKTDTGAWTDESHYTALNTAGIMERARSLMAMTLRDTGILSFADPQIDTVIWSPDHVRISSSAGPITTIARRQGLAPLDPTISPLFDADVLGFAVAHRDQTYRTRIVAPGTTTPADAGDLLVYPNEGTFDGTAKLFFEQHSGGLFMDSYDYYRNDGPKHRAIVDVGIVGWTGMKVQIPSSIERLNVANDLPFPSGVYTLPSNQLKFQAPYLPNTNQLTFETRLRYLGGNTGVLLLWAERDDQLISMTSAGDVRVQTRAAAASTAVFNATFAGAVADTSALNTIRAIIDYPSSTVRLFVNGTELKNGKFGVPGQVSASGSDRLRNGNVSLLSRQTAAIDYLRVWTSATPDGSVPTTQPWVSAEARPGNTVLLSSNVTAVLQ